MSKGQSPKKERKLNVKRRFIKSNNTKTTPPSPLTKILQRVEELQKKKRLNKLQTSRYPEEPTSCLQKKNKLLTKFVKKLKKNKFPH